MAELTNPTAGWDLMFAVRYKQLNAAIAKGNVTPPELLYEASGSKGPVKVQAQFDAWRVTTGGSGKNIRMALPMRSGTVTVNNEVIAFDSLTAFVTVTAKFIAKAGAPSDKTFDLKVDTTSGNVTFDPALGQVFPDKAFHRAVMESGVREWLKSNLDQFSHVFVSVDLFEEADIDGYAWMAPTQVDYAVSEPIGATEDMGVFTVLAMTESRDNAAKSDQFGANVLAEGQSAGVLISSERFLSKLLLPTVPVLFSPYPDISKFELFSENRGIQNVSSLQFGKLKVDKDGDDKNKDDDKTIEPRIGARNFSLRIEKTDLVISIKPYSYKWSPGITVNANYEAYTKLSYDSATKLLELQYSQGREDGAVITVGGSIDLSTGVLVGTAVASIAVGVAFAALGAYVGARIGGSEGAVAPGASATELSIVSVSYASRSSSEMASEEASGAVSSEITQAAGEVMASTSSSAAERGPNVRLLRTDEPENQSRAFRNNRWRTGCCPWRDPRRGRGDSKYPRSEKA